MAAANTNMHGIVSQGMKGLRNARPTCDETMTKNLLGASECGGQRREKNLLGEEHVWELDSCGCRYESGDECLGFGPAEEVGRLR